MGDRMKNGAIAAVLVSVVILFVIYGPIVLFVIAGGVYVASLGVQFARYLKRRNNVHPERRILSALLDAAASDNYSTVGNVDSLAEKLEMTPDEVRSIVQQLVDKGYLTVAADTDGIHPTAWALRWQNPYLSERNAKEIERIYLGALRQESPVMPQA